MITFDFRDGYDPALRQNDLVGEIYIGASIAERQAKEFGTSFQSELVRYVTHGILHLLGYDHADEAEAAIMEGLESAVLADLGFPDPYADD